MQAAVVACLEVVADRLPEGGHEADGLGEAGVATIPKDNSILVEGLLVIQVLVILLEYHQKVDLFH